jgi:hypothetical protein
MEFVRNHLSKGTSMTEPSQTPSSDITHAHHDPSAEVVDPKSEPKFSEEEIESFRHADRYAGAAIVLLMAGVFTVGLILYIIVNILTLNRV